MSETHRIEGIKINFGRMSREEIEGLRGHLLERHVRLMGEIALVEAYLEPEYMQPTLFDNVIQFPEPTPPGVA